MAYPGEELKWVVEREFCTRLQAIKKAGLYFARTNKKFKIVLCEKEIIGLTR